MQHSKSLPEHNGLQSTSRRGKQVPSTPQATNDLPLQKTISELFASSKRQVEDLETLSKLSPRKRLRLDSTIHVQDDNTTQTKTIGPENMYTFNSTSPMVNGVIDLTGSPDSSPSKASPFQRRPSGAVRPTNFTPHTGPRKLVVRNLRTTPKSSPDQYFNQMWHQLDGALSAIFSHEKLPYPNEELYRGVENICRQDRAPALYLRLCEKCKGNISGNVKASLVTSAKDVSEVEVLRAVVEAWSTWNKQVTTTRSIFYYMDRSYLLRSPTQLTIAEMGTAQFRSHIFSDSALKSRILQGACNLVEYDRTGQQEFVDNGLFRDAVEMFHGLSVYDKEFEPKMLGESQRFFVERAQSQSSTSSLAEYIDASQNLIDSEMLRCNSFKLDLTTQAQLTILLDTFLIEQREASLTRIEDVSDLMRHDWVDSLQKLYVLLECKGLGENLRAPFEAYINAEGSEIVFDEEREGEMVARLLQFKRKLDLIWASPFQKHEGLGHSLSDAFESFINRTKKSNMTWGTDNPKPGEMIAKHVDVILKGGVKASPVSKSTPGNSIIVPNDDDVDDTEEDVDVQINKQLDQVLELFRFVHGKAVFEAFYKKDLARRLLMGRSASADAEKSMLTRLKSECGSGFTHNLEQMFKDIELGREEMSSYKRMLEERQKYSPVDLNVNILSASAWPTYPDVTVEVPVDIQKATADFEQHYLAKHTGRKLAWKHALAHCQLKANFPQGNKELVVSSFQAIVLLLFNAKAANESMCYTEIQAATSLDPVELKRTLQSLACARFRPLTKTPKSKEINETDAFAVNLNFADPHYRIKINTIQLKETKEENKETHERVAADRHYETQAAIVRILKSRKKIKHAELVAEVIKATKSRGVLDPADIKKNIEKLIEKDYMEREEGNTYRYLA